MVRKGIIYEKSYAEELLRIAKADFEAAQVLYEARVKRKENIFLLAQQALEKALKAVLCAMNLPVPHVHEISLLVDRIPEELNPPFSTEFNSLTEFATIRRYLEGKEIQDEELTLDVLNQIEQALAWCSRTVSAHAEP